MRTVAEPARATLTPALTGRLVADRYTIEEELGRGGFGTVYGASAGGGERVAVKVFSRREGLAPRADREARTARKLDHPNIHTVLGVEGDDDHVYLVSKLVEGERLDRSGLDGRAGRARDRRGVRRPRPCPRARDRAPRREAREHPGGPGRDASRSPTSASPATRTPATRRSTSACWARCPTCRPSRRRARAPPGATDVWAAGLTLYAQLTGANPYRAKTLAQLLEKLADGRRAARGRCGPTCRPASAAPSTRPSTTTPSRRPAATELRDRLLRGARRGEVRPSEAEAAPGASPANRHSQPRPSGTPRAPAASIRPAPRLLSGLAMAWVLVAFPVYPAAWSLPLAA